MNVILILVGFSLMVALAGLAAFFWSVRNGQYDDPYGSSVRILFDDERPEESESPAADATPSASPTKKK